GRANGSDCAPFDPTATDPPTEATNLSVVGSSACTLSWDTDPAQGAGLTFEILRDDTASLAIDQGVASSSCLRTALTGCAGPDMDVPGAGQSFYYLVRKRNACGAGSLGFDSSGHERHSSVCP